MLPGQEVAVLRRQVCRPGLAGPGGRAALARRRPGVQRAGRGTVSGYIGPGWIPARCRTASSRLPARIVRGGNPDSAIGFACFQR